MTRTQQLAREVSKYSLMLHERGWVANHDGNVSARITNGRGGFLITPTAVSKRVCTPDTIVTCNDEGKPTSRGRPPSEVALHIGAYGARPKVNAVIHAHPPYASAFALARQPLGPVAMPEIVVSLGADIPLAPMALPKDPNARQVAADAVMKADAVLLTGNGVLAVGVDLEQAFLRLELVEHYAKIISIARSIGGPAPLEADAMSKMLALRAKAGLGPPQAPAAAKTAPSSGLDAHAIRPIVAEEIRRVLEGTKS